MKILVVEDEKKIREFLKESLEAECFAVDISADGEQGSYLARINEYDIIILDNILPKKTGLEVCTEIRSAGKHTPILVVSVKADPEEKTQFLDAGADDYMSKPFVLAELVARVRALLRRPASIAADTLTVGDLSICSKSFSVMRGKRKIYLTRKEFMLLNYLMRNAGNVLSRGMILEHVWDMSIDIFSNTIESHILSLRKKIGDRSKNNKLIHTVPGRGYKIEAY